MLNLSGLSLILFGSLYAPLAHTFYTSQYTTTITTNNFHQQRYLGSRGRYSVLSARIPEVNNWDLVKGGSVSGRVKFHPVLKDGDQITTSPLKDPKKATENSMVETRSGSMYKLKNASRSMKNKLEKETGKAQKKPAIKAKVVNTPKPSPKPNSVPTPPVKTISKPKPVPKPTTPSIAKKSTTTPTKQPATATPAPADPTPAKEKTVKVDGKSVPVPLARKLAIKSHRLTGKSIGAGRWLLSGKAFRSTSGKSQIWDIYEADSDGIPLTAPVKDGGNRLKAKISTNKEALKRESENYSRVTSGLFQGCFVKKLDFIEDCSGDSGFETQSTLVIEGGVKDLKEFFIRRGRQGLKGRALRDAAAAAGQCVQAMHSSNLVWTDVKPDNFVLTIDSNGENGFPGIKGIDLESAIPFNQNPVNYSPEACPPEFAEAFVKGDAGDFILRPSYDMWSLGMLLYEMGTGTAYFRGKSPEAITNALKVETFEADVSAIKDEKLRDLVGQCLSRDPKKRPSITGFLLHPFFTTTGIGPISF